MNSTSIRYNNFLALLILLYAFLSLIPSLEKIYLFGIIPFLFLISVWKKPMFLFESRIFCIYVVYVLYNVLSIFWADDIDLSLSFFRTYLGTFLFVYILSSYSTNIRYRRTIFALYICYFISCFILGLTQYNFASSDITSERVGGEGLNGNRFGYFLFFITILIYYWGELRNNKLLRFIFFLIPILSFYLALLTGARQILLIQIPLFICLIYKRYFYKTNPIVSLIFLLSLIVIVFLLYPVVMNLYDNSYLSVRAEEDITDDARAILMRIAIDVGSEHPIFGVGLSNFLLYSNGAISHCSYTEAFAEGGIIGLLLYVSILFIYCWNQIKRYRVTKDGKFITFLIFGIFYIIDNLFFVFQYFNLLMAFIFVMEQESVYRYSCCMRKLRN